MEAISAPKSSFIFSSIGKKIFMALTGLFLCTFLAAHLAGNLTLLLPPSIDTMNAFNEYTYFMMHNPFIKILSYVTYAAILLHALDGIILSIQNRKARPLGYAKSKPNANSHVFARNMGILGLVVLAYIVFHLSAFWWDLKFGSVPEYELFGYQEGIKNIYVVVLEYFSQWWAVLLYVIGVAFIGFHLYHGFNSAFQTLGLTNSKYRALVKNLGLVFYLLIPIGFILIPIVVFIYTRTMEMPF